MKLLLVFLLSLFSVFICGAQTDSVGFFGTIEIKDAGAYSYALKFKVTPSSNTMLGYSVNDINGKYETKTAIEGKYDSVKKLIAFKETKIISTKSNLKREDLCFITCTLKFKNNKMGQVLEGEFVGYESDGKKVCGNGKIKMMNVQKAMEKIQALMDKYSDKKSKTQSTSKAKKSNQNVVIEKQKQVDLKVSSDSLYLSIWDDGKVDDDAVSIYLNDKLILEKYYTKSKPKIVKQKLVRGKENIIKIVALNEGKIPPNSTKLLIETDDEVFPFEINANEGEEKLFKINVD